MGCCSSKPSSDESDPNRPSEPHNQNNTTQQTSQDRARAQQTGHPSSTSAPNASTTRSSNPQSSSQPGDKPATGGPFTLHPAPTPDKIKPPPNAQIVTSYAASLPPLTRSQLLKERRDFFDTRVSGTREAWSAMEYVCDLVERGDLDAAKSVLDAAGCSCPSGDLHGKRGGAYDDKGTRYVVPAWLLGEPEGTVKDEVDGEKTRVGGSEGEDEDDDDDEKEKVVKLAAAAEKGKGKAVAAPAAKMLAVRVRLSNTGRDVVVKFGEDESVGSIAVKIKEQAEMAPDARIKIMYLGKPLLEDRTLLSQGWQKDNTIIAFVFG